MDEIEKLQKKILQSPATTEAVAKLVMNLEIELKDKIKKLAERVEANKFMIEKLIEIGVKSEKDAEAHKSVGDKE